MASGAAQTHEESIVEIASLASGAKLNSFLPCHIGTYAVVLQVDNVIISTELGLSYSSGVYYPSIGREAPNALVSATSITNGAVAEIQFTFVIGPVVTLLFYTGTVGLTLRNDDASAITSVCLSMAFDGVIMP